MLYDFEPEKMYTLTQTTAPKGYVGLSKKLCFKVRTDETVELYYENGTTPWGNTDAADSNWAKWQRGNRGITAFVDVYNKQFKFKIARPTARNPR